MEIDRIYNEDCLILVLFHDSERYNLNPLLSEEAKIRIMSIILSDFGTRKKQIERQIK